MGLILNKGTLLIESSLNLRITHTSFMPFQTFFILTLKRVSSLLS